MSQNIPVSDRNLCRKPFLILHSPHILSSPAACCCQIKAQKCPPLRKTHGTTDNPVCGASQRSNSNITLLLIFRSWTDVLLLLHTAGFPVTSPSVFPFMLSNHPIPPLPLSLPSRCTQLVAGQTACYTLISDTIRLLILAPALPPWCRGQRSLLQALAWVASLWNCGSS